jgi:hypothetical protein
MGVEFVQYTLMPWFIRWEQGVYRGLLTPAERKTLFAEHLVDSLMRGKTLDRYQAYQIARNGGWLNADDIRDKENMNPLPDGQGQIYLAPMNMVPLDQIGGGPLDQSIDAGANGQRSLPAGREWRDLSTSEREFRSKTSATNRHRLMMRFRKVYLDTTRRMINRETNDLREGLRKYFGSRDYGQFSVWLDEYYRDLPAYLRRQILPVAQSYGGAIADQAREEIGSDALSEDSLDRFIRAYVEAFISRHVLADSDRVRMLVKRAIDENRDPLPDLEAELDNWDEGKPDAIANGESTRTGNAVAKTVYIAAGVMALRWFAFGKSCPYCESLDGKTIGIQDVFAAAGEDFQPDGADAPITPNRDIGHPPIHDGCDCQIGAA